MRYRVLGQTELEVSTIGLGCATFGREIDQAASFEILDHALERGINFFDTAELYGEGTSETVLGEWVSSRGVRDRVVIASKVKGTLTAKRVRESAEASLRRLKIDCLDLFQLHDWDAGTPVEETLQAMGLLVEQGKVRYVGCSNWSAEQLSIGLELSGDKAVPRIASVQPPYNLVQRDIEADLLPVCQEQGVGVITYSPLAAGFLTGKYQRGGNIPEGARFDVIPGHQQTYFTDEGFAVVKKLSQVAQESGRAMVELALAWVIARPGVTSVLAGARTTSQVDQFFGAEEFLLQSDAAQLLEEI